MTAASRPGHDLAEDRPPADATQPPHAEQARARPPDAVEDAAGPPDAVEDGAGPPEDGAGPPDAVEPTAEPPEATTVDAEETAPPADPVCAAAGATTTPASGAVATQELPPPAAPVPAEEITGEAPASPRRHASRRAVTTAFTAVFATWVLLDQVTKELATRWFAADPVDLGFVRLVDVRNPNAAFGIPGFPGLFPLVTAVVVVLVLRVLPGTDRLSLAVAYGLVTGGAVGNVIDRLFRAPGFPSGSVVDFIDLGWWPVFNLADTGICVGAAMVALQLSKVDREERESAAAAASAQPSVRPEPRPPHA